MQKSIIIDFDNTIGYFSQIVYLINIIEKTYNRKMTQNDVNTLLKIYTNSFRPKIFEILKFICQLKNKNIIHSLILYTKNKNEVFVKMVVLFIEEVIYRDCGKSDKEITSVFDEILFSKSKYKHIEQVLKLKCIQEEIKTKLCFIDNKKYKYETSSKYVTVYFIECDTYKFYYTNNEIAKKMNYEIYSKLDKKILNKYFKNIYKNKKIIGNIPLKVHEFNSLYIFNLLNNFCFLTK
tara:strand:+ start:1083 stop:1790 length:708 start_codon:yes stop_codon:yes gene_type:complete